MKEIKSVYFTGEPAFLIGSYYTDIGGVQSIPDLVSYCKVANLAGDNINTIYNYQQEEEDWEALSESKDWRIKAAIASQKKSYSSKFSKDKDWRIRNCVAMKGWECQHLCSDENIVVKINAIIHGNFSDNVLELLSHDKNPAIRTAVVNAGYYTYNLALDDNEDVKEALFVNDRFLDVLAMDDDLDMVSLVAETGKYLDVLTNHKSEMVRIACLRSDEILLKPEYLNKLLQDEDITVREAARERLKDAPTHSLYCKSNCGEDDTSTCSILGEERSVDKRIHWVAITKGGKIIGFQFYPTPDEIEAEELEQFFQVIGNIDITNVDNFLSYKAIYPVDNKY